MLYFPAVALVNQGEMDETPCAITKACFMRCKKELEEYRMSRTTTCQFGYGNTSEHNLRITNDDAIEENCSQVGDSGIELVNKNKNISMPVSSILPPVIVNKYGRPSSKRIRSSMEANIRKKKKGSKPSKKNNEPGGYLGLPRSRFCSKCHSPTHNIKDCPHLILT